MRAALRHAARADVLRDGLGVLGPEAQQRLDEVAVLFGAPVARPARAPGARLPHRARPQLSHPCATHERCGTVCESRRPQR